MLTTNNEKFRYKYMLDLWVVHYRNQENFCMVLHTLAKVLKLSTH